MVRKWPTNGGKMEKITIYFHCKAAFLGPNFGQSVQKGIAITVARNSESKAIESAEKDSLHITMTRPWAEW